MEKITKVYVVESEKYGAQYYTQDKVYGLSKYTPQEMAEFIVDNGVKVSFHKLES